MEAAVGDLFGELDRLQQLQGRVDALRAGVGALHRLDLVATSAPIADRRRRAERAEARPDALRARLAAIEGWVAAGHAAVEHPHGDA